ncbi:hypothetical protein STAL104432_29040 [Streptomyces albus]
MSRFMRLSMTRTTFFMSSKVSASAWAMLAMISVFSSCTPAADCRSRAVSVMRVTSDVGVVEDRTG